ncbi:MAG: DUF4872 domain-containing protein [Candidatus Heimdallarchaeota archaeon]|nr:DUF4872 domain-containing protein [Candidatus Heimdallarchaeota archaeon]
MNKINSEFDKPNKFPFKPAGLNDEVIMLDFQHIPNGKNCQTSALHKLCHHYDLDITEEMLVGIGSGLGFIYWYMKKMPMPFAGAMNSGKFPGLVGRIIERLGGSYQVLKTTSVKKAHKHLKETLKMGQPAFVCADMAYVDYFGTTEEDHFGQHTFLVYGINEPENLAYIADRFDVECTLPLTRLQQARASPFPPFPAKNQMVRFSFPENLPDLKTVIPVAVKDNIDYLLNPPIKNMGLSGFLKWKKELNKYPQIIDGAWNLVASLMWHFVYIETGGTGGAFFRNIYTEFLKEAFKITGKNFYLDASNEYAIAAEFWEKIAHKFLPDDYSELKEIREIQYTNQEDLEKEGNSARKKILTRQKRLDALLKQSSKYIETEFKNIINPIQELLLEVHQKENEALAILKSSL